MVGIKDTHFWSTDWYRNITILDLNPSICDKSHSCLSIWTVDLSSLYRLDIQFVQNGEHACEWRIGGGCVCEPSVYIWVPANSLSAGVCEDWIGSYSSRSQKHQLVPETKSDNSSTWVSHTHTHTKKIYQLCTKRHIFFKILFVIFCINSDLLTAKELGLNWEMNTSLHADMWPHGRHTQLGFRFNLQIPALTNNTNRENAALVANWTSKLQWQSALSRPHS